MKNIHILPTDKPSRLSKQLDNPLVLYKQFIENRKFGKWSINQNIYITNDEEIKEGDWVMSNYGELIKISYKGSKVKENVNKYCKKIILTTDQDLIKDGIQAIDDEFLEWFVKNPSCEEVEVERDSREVGGHNGVQIEYGYYEIIIPKEEPKQETLEEFSERYANMQEDVSETIGKYLVKAVFKDGAKWQQERSYSEEEVRKLLLNCPTNTEKETIEWFNKFKKK